MKPAIAYVSNLIEIDLSQFGSREDEILEAIKPALEFPNVNKEQMILEEIGGWWGMDDTLTLWNRYLERDRWILELPRGFAWQLQNGLKEMGYELIWEDRRREEWIDTTDWSVIDTRSHQDEFVERALAEEQGVWEAPPGAGKTVGVLELVRQAGQRTIVIVDKTNIARQWAERAQQFLSIEVGIVGDKKWEERDLTIALQQTLWARSNEP